MFFNFEVKSQSLYFLKHTKTGEFIVEMLNIPIVVQINSNKIYFKSIQVSTISSPHYIAKFIIHQVTSVHANSSLTCLLKILRAHACYSARIILTIYLAWSIHLLLWDNHLNGAEYLSFYIFHSFISSPTIYNIQQQRNAITKQKKKQNSVCHICGHFVNRFSPFCVSIYV